MNDDISQSVCYLDTNIFVYMHDGNEVEKRSVSNRLYKSFLRTGRGRIAVQVIAEWRNTMVRKFPHFVTKEERRRFMRLLEVWNPLVITPLIIMKAEELCDHYHLSPYDSVHVQCALEQNCRYFLSEDMQDGLIVNNTLTFRNPYKTSS